MVFSSLNFPLLFLQATVLAYTIAPARSRERS
jgi:hypothetical protein